MSDYVIRIIPTDPYLRIPEESLQSAKELLADRITCDNIQIHSFENTSFIDCGGNLQRISCPHCGSEVDFAWWGDEVSKLYDKSFISLSVCMPCCNKVSSMNDLLYDYPCGFALSVLEVLNPGVEITAELKEKIESIIGSSIRIINAHI